MFRLMFFSDRREVREGSLCQNYAVKMKRREEIRNAFVLKRYLLLSLSTSSLQPFDFLRLAPLSAP